MTLIRPMTLGLLALCAAACGGASQAEDPEPQPAPETTFLSVRYDGWEEDIHVDGDARTLVHSRTRYEFPDPTSSVPSGSTVQTLVEEPVTREDLEALDRFVRGLELETLEGRYGAPEGHRFYPYDIEVEFPGGGIKRIEYRSNPEFDGPPEAFRELEDYLRQLSITVGER